MLAVCDSVTLEGTCKPAWACDFCLHGLHSPLWEKPKATVGNAGEPKLGTPHLSTGEKKK